MTGPRPRIPGWLDRWLERATVRPDVLPARPSSPVPEFLNPPPTMRGADRPQREPNPRYKPTDADFPAWATGRAFPEALYNSLIDAGRRGEHRLTSAQTPQDFVGVAQDALKTGAENLPGPGDVKAAIDAVGELGKGHVGPALMIAAMAAGGMPEGRPGARVIEQIERQVARSAERAALERGALDLPTYARRGTEIAEHIGPLTGDQYVTHKPAQVAERIAAPEVKGVDGVWYTGVSHDDAREKAAEAIRSQMGGKLKMSQNSGSATVRGTDGFRTNTGRHITRDEARNVAGFSGQAPNLAPQYTQLHSSDLKAPERIVSPAVRVGGKEFLGANHGIAMDAAEAAGATGLHEDRLFKTSTGRIVDWREAAQISEAAGQRTARPNRPLHPVGLISEELPPTPGPAGLGQLGEQRADYYDKLPPQNYADQFADIQPARYAIVTAENPGGQRATRAVNKVRQQALVSELKARGYTPVEVRGGYKDPSTGRVLRENSLIVPNMPEREAKLLGTRYGQNSVITQGGFHDLKSGQMFPSRGVQPGDINAFTTLPSGKRFKLDINWDEPTRSGVQALPRSKPFVPGPWSQMPAVQTEALSGEAGKIAERLRPDEQSLLGSKAAREDFKTAARVVPAPETLAAGAQAGAEKKGWYEASSAALKEMFGADAPRFAAVLAALSPQQPVERNLEMALEFWRNWKGAGSPQEADAIKQILRSSIPGGKSLGDNWDNNLIRAINAPDAGNVLLSGPKVTSFHRNLTGDPDAVTLDTWMAKLANIRQRALEGRRILVGGEQIAVPHGPYLAYSGQVRRAADLLPGWNPANVQESLWSWGKGISEGDPTNIFPKLEGVPDFATLLRTDQFRPLVTGAGGQLPTGPGLLGMGVDASKIDPQGLARLQENLRRFAKKDYLMGLGAVGLGGWGASRGLLAPQQQN